MMLSTNARFTILTGHYGSGKTELALALARDARRRLDRAVALVDLDIVNPYFRSAEQKEALEAEGIEVFMPSFALSTVDIPALPAQIQRVFDGDYAHVVIDVGGDDTGAVALGRYHPYLTALREEIQTLYVVNALRPMSSTVDDIVNMFALIKARGRLQPDFLVNNTNLQGETTGADLIQAQALLQEVSARLQVPIVLVVGQERLYDHLPPAMQALFFPLSPVMKPEWLEEGGHGPTRHRNFPKGNECRTRDTTEGRGAGDKEGG